LKNSSNQRAAKNSSCLFNIHLNIIVFMATIMQLSFVMAQSDYSQPRDATMTVVISPSPTPFTDYVTPSVPYYLSQTTIYVQTSPVSALPYSEPVKNHYAQPSMSLSPTPFPDYVKPSVPYYLSQATPVSALPYSEPVKNYYAQPSMKPRCPNPPAYNFTANPNAVSECDIYYKAFSNCTSNSVPINSLYKCMEEGLRTVSTECATEGIQANRPECICQNYEIRARCFADNCPALSYLPVCPQYKYEMSWYCDKSNVCNVPVTLNTAIPLPIPIPLCPDPPRYDFKSNNEEIAKCAAIEALTYKCSSFTSAANSTLSSDPYTLAARNMGKCVANGTLSLSTMCRNGGLDQRRPECMCPFRAIKAACYNELCPGFRDLSISSPCPKDTFETQWLCDQFTKCSLPLP
jgi:hypothetical protein